jgi:hypothetical protein
MRMGTWKRDEEEKWAAMSLMLLAPQEEGAINSKIQGKCNYIVRKIWYWGGE